MVFVANEPVGNLTAFDMPLVCTCILLSCVHFVAMSCEFLVLLEAKEVAMNLMTCLRLALFTLFNFGGWFCFRIHPIILSVISLGVGSRMSEYNTPWA